MKNERRMYKRFPIISMIKKISIKSEDKKRGITTPAILFNLSAGGISIITERPIALNTLIRLNFNLAGLLLQDIEGMVVRTEGRKRLYLIVVGFTKIDDEIKNRINLMAEDFDVCEAKLLQGKDVNCTKKCRYYKLCTKNVKRYY